MEGYTAKCLQKGIGSVYKLAPSFVLFTNTPGGRIKQKVGELRGGFLLKNFLEILEGGGQFPLY